jgi:hypothetical protein
MRASLTVLTHRGLSPHQFTPMSGAHNFVQATPVCAILFVLSQLPGVPDDNRSAPPPMFFVSAITCFSVC